MTKERQGFICINHSLHTSFTFPRITYTKDKENKNTANYLTIFANIFTYYSSANISTYYMFQYNFIRNKIIYVNTKLIIYYVFNYVEKIVTII